MKAVVAVCALALASVPLVAQQGGVTVGRTPNSTPGRELQVQQVPLPKATCDAPPSPTLPAVPELVFSRMMDDLVCVRHADGRSEQVTGAGPWTSLSPDGNDVAYWVPDSHEMHVFSTATRSDVVLETVPGAIMREIVWAERGRLLAYSLTKANPPGVRVVDLTTGKRRILNASVTSLAGFADAEHLLTVNSDGVQRVNLADGRRETLAVVKFATEAQYSRSGTLLGILAPNVDDPAAPASGDDEPDCTGGTSALFVRTASGAVIKVPFPEGFNSVLDFDISPDDRTVAVTFGAAACDYPGDVARVFVVSLADVTLKPLSPHDRLSVKAHWSPDANVIVYSDYTAGNESPLMAVDVKSGKTAKLTHPGPNGPDEFLGWRRKSPAPTEVGR